jgi:hypothetical protein
MKGQLYLSSNNQLVCLSNHILSRAGRPIPTGWVFDNGTILKIVGLESGKSHISMIHPLVVSNPARFVSLEKVNAAFAGVSLPIPAGTVIYLGRHGHAGHNEPAATLIDSHDASLTSTGIAQAREMGKAIFDDAHYKNISIFRAYCSDLRRTMETCNVILEYFQYELRQFHALSGMPLSRFSMRWTSHASIRIGDEDTIGTDSIHSCQVCIQARENIRAIGAEHNWQVDNPLRELAIDPFRSLEDLRVLAPGKPDDVIDRMRVENLPKNDPIGNPDACVKRIGHLEIDWTDYIDILTRAKEAGESFGQAASKKLLLDVILENAQQ